MIFRREFSRNLKSLLIWSIALGGLVYLVLSIYPQLSAQTANVSELFKAYPEAFKKAFGMDKLDFSTILGFYGLEVYVMTTLFGSIFASMLASSILSKEENEKTIEFLLSKPVTRIRVITEKFLLLAVNIVLLNGVAVLASVTGFERDANAEVSYETYGLLALATVLLHFTFASISFLLSAVLKRSRNILSASLGIVLIAYFLFIITGISEQLDFLKYFSPFKYVAAADIITENRIEPLYVMIMCSVIFLCSAASFLVYRRKDINV